MNVAVVGATGLAGREIIKILAQRSFPVNELRLFASPNSEGLKLSFKDKGIVCQTLQPGCFHDIDLVLMEVDASLAKFAAREALDSGAIVIDNSSAYRYEESVPLVVPEINWHLLEPKPKLIASPNCTTLALVPVLHVLDKEFMLQSVTVTTFQAVSGTGQKARAELENQATYLAKNLKSLGITPLNELDIPASSSYPVTIGFNVIPQADEFLEGESFTKEEWKIIAESRKILNKPNLEIMPTCVRVPVWIGHSMSVVAEFEDDVDLNKAKELLAAAQGIHFWGANTYPTPLEIAGTDGVHVGRLRMGTHKNILQMWISADNLRKGAALNAVQIAEILMEEKF